MSGVDQSIIFFYLCVLIILGIFLKRWASRSIDPAKVSTNRLDRHHSPVVHRNATGIPNLKPEQHWPLLCLVLVFIQGELSKIEA